MAEELARLRAARAALAAAAAQAEAALNDVMLNALSELVRDNSWSSALSAHCTARNYEHYMQAGANRWAIFACAGVGPGRGRGAAAAGAAAGGAAAPQRPRRLPAGAAVRVCHSCWSRVGGHDRMHESEPAGSMQFCRIRDEAALPAEALRSWNLHPSAETRDHSSLGCLYAVSARSCMLMPAIPCDRDTMMQQQLAIEALQADLAASREQQVRSRSRACGSSCFICCVMQCERHIQLRPAGCRGSAARPCCVAFHCSRSVGASATGMESPATTLCMVPRCFSAASPLVSPHRSSIWHTGVHRRKPAVPPLSGLHGRRQW